MKGLPMREDDLQAYVDDRLDPVRRAEVDDWLVAHPLEAARLRSYRKQNKALQALFAPVLDEPLPEALKVARPQAKPKGMGLLRMAAMLAAVGLGSVLGWTLRGEVQLVQARNEAVAPAQLPALQMATVATADTGLARRAAVAHAVYSPDVRRPVEIGADQEDQLVAWLSKRLGSNLKPPKLGRLGYELIGGRLLPGDKGPVAQFMYHDASGKRLTLYVSRETGDDKETAFQFSEIGPIGVFFWVDRGVGYAISAGADKAELAQVAVTVHEQLRLP
jgi:anti-sigma factor RsiW